jgi:hypothetical protein
MTRALDGIGQAILRGLDLDPIDERHMSIGTRPRPHGTEMSGALADLVALIWRHA